MKSKLMNNPVKTIGKNCKHNKKKEGIIICNNCLSIRLSTKKLCPECAESEIIGKQTRAVYYCEIKKKNKVCGLNHTCNCFDNQGKLCFERKDK